VRPPLIFPNILRIPEGRTENLHWRVPIDDHTTAIIVMRFTPAEPGQPAPRQASIPTEIMPDDYDAAGNHGLNNFYSQDRMAWETQGPVLDRSKELLGSTDRGIVMFRKLLDEQIAIVEKGGDPMALLRDPKKNEIIAFTSHSVNRLDPVT